MSENQFQYGRNVLTFDRNGQISCYSNKESSKGTQLNCIKYRLSNSPIIFNKTKKKCCIFLEKCFVYDLNQMGLQNEINFPNQDQLLNLEWSQIEENYLIASYPDRINLVDSSNSHLIHSFKFNNIKKCKAFKNQSITSKFSLIAIAESRCLVLISPFVSKNFILTDKEFKEFKADLPDLNKGYFDQCFENIEMNSSELSENPNPNEQTHSKTSTSYRFKGTFGISIEPLCFPLNAIFNSDVIDFDFRNEEIFLSTEDSSIYKISIPTFPSIFDPQTAIDCNIQFLSKITISRFISSGSFIFGTSKDCTLQFFEECVVQVSDKNNLISVHKEDDNNLLLFFDDGSVSKIEDLSLYYENRLSTRLKQLQARKEELLSLKQSVELKIRNFRTTLAQLVSVEDVKKLEERVDKIKEMKPNHRKEAAIFEKAVEIDKALPALTKTVFNNYIKYSDIFENYKQPIKRLENNAQMTNSNEPPIFSPEFVK